ncbi:type IV pilin [Halorarius halobius]|uniref:type IV pilin n=1 Tax=Halorarius halobius TaxID=2962671 RepID=UPI0020CC50A7|nr:type IV pilin N-terminal domain-containing protein [Halorarius halobius]
MQLQTLVSDDDAVSPVIGVILMVAITVILAAVIGTFVLGLGDQVQSSAPNANFQFEYSDATIDDTSNGNGPAETKEVVVTHDGGQDVNTDNIVVQIDGSPAYGLDSTTNSGPVGVALPFAGVDSLSTGDSATFYWVNTDSNTIEASDTITDTGTSSLSASGGSPFSPEVIESGDTVRIVWQAPGGGSSNTIGESEVPS